MSDGAVHLHQYPAEKVHVTCSSCQRGGRFDKAALIERVGANAPLPELRLRLAEGLGCETAAKTRAGEWLPGGVMCGMHFPDLVATHQKQPPTEGGQA
jgi:hypothetical protein